MTTTRMDLHDVVGKTPDADFLRDMIGFATKRLMELEVGGLTGAGYGEKDPDRLVQRNGYRERDWETRPGTVELHIPKLRKAQAQEGKLLSWFSRAAPDGGEGADGGHSGGLHSGDIDTLG